MNRKLLGNGAHVIGYFLIFLCVLCGQSHAQQFKMVAPGVEYAEVTREIDKQPVRMNLLRLDLTKVRLDVVHAMDAAIGLEKTSSIATRHGAFAAINGGYFRLDDSIWAGDPAGVFMIDGKLLSESIHNRVALIIGNGNRSSFQGIHRLSTINSFRIGKHIGSNPITLSGVDRERKLNEIILYDHLFGQRTRTDDSGIEVILSGCTVEREPRGYFFNMCRRLETKIGSGNDLIPRDGFVISFSSGRMSQWQDFVGEADKNGFSGTRKVFIENAYGLDEDTLFIPDPYTDIVGGVPQLMKNGKIDITWEQEKTNKTFVETKHPRTAVAKLKDGKFLMITVDGRTESSGGISLTDLAAYLLELGATDAMNLDGGGSSTMFLDGKVVNHPSDKEGERKVSDAILVTVRPTRKKK